HAPALRRRDGEGRDGVRRPAGQRRAEDPAGSAAVRGVRGRRLLHRRRSGQLERRVRGVHGGRDQRDHGRRQELDEHGPAAHLAAVLQPVHHGSDRREAPDHGGPRRGGDNGGPFANGIATDVGGSQAPKRLTGDGWHIAAAHGLPVRYISSIRMDPSNPRTVYVTVGGYGRKWAPPGAVKDDTGKVGTGHVFKPTDPGEHFTDITGNLPDVPANWVIARGGQLIVGTDIGVFASSDTNGSSWAVLGNGLPNVPVTHLEVK